MFLEEQEPVKGVKTSMNWRLLILPNHHQTSPKMLDNFVAYINLEEPIAYNLQTVSYLSL